MENNKLFKLLQEWKMTDRPLESIYKDIAVVMPGLSEKEISVALTKGPIEDNWG